GADDVAVDDGTNVVGGGHGVHVTAQQKWRDVGRGARKASQQVAGVAADLFPGVVDLHARAQVLENRGQAFGDIALALADTRNPCQIEKFVAQSSLVHRKNFLSQSRLAATACARWAGSVRR